MRDGPDCLVTVVMAVHNDEDSLRQAMESILAQTFQDFEFLIINDGSADNSREVVLSHNDPRIRLLNNVCNIGLTRSLNRGLRKAGGDFVARMDADDISMPGRLAAQVAALQSQQADVCFCECYFVDEDADQEWIWTAGDWDLMRWRGLFANSYGLHPSVMFRKEAILTLGGYDESFIRAQDYELWDRCMAHGLKFVYVPEPLLRYRLRAQGISRQHLADQEQYARQVSFRAMRCLLSDTNDDELWGLRWLFLQRETKVSDETVRAGVHRCRELISSFLQTCESRHSRAVWNDVAVCLASRLRGMDNRSRWAALRVILPAIKHARSARCIIRVMRAFYNSIRKQR